MAKIRVFMTVYEDAIKAESEQTDLADAIDRELGWLHDSGIAIETWDYADRPSRFPDNVCAGFGGERNAANKCRMCPRKKTCRETCYGETPCTFAKVFDQIAFHEDLQTTCIESLRAERNEARRGIPAHRVFGDYVLTPIPNAFNGNTSWWISKKGFAIAHYCFSASDPAEVDRQILDGLEGYIKLLEAQIE